MTVAAPPRSTRELLSRVVRHCATVLRTEWPFLLALALLIFIPLGLVEALMDVAETDELSPALGLLVGSLVVGAMMGEVLFSGAVAALLTKTPPGERPSIGRWFRELAWWKLIAADILVPLVVVAGLFLLIVPGVLFLAWFAFVAPVIEIEDRGLRDSFRRSRELVRGHFWIVLATVLGVTLSSEAVISGIVDLSHSLLGENLLADWLAEATGSVLTSPISALVAVVMAVEIMRERGEAPEHAMEAQPR